MKAKGNDKGFSLVELIIVIAIMAVLIGVLAPQYLKYVNNARVSTDITNAFEMAKAVDAAHARSYGGSVPELIEGTGGTTVSNVPGLEVLPTCKLNPDYSWKIISTRSGGVTEVTLNGYSVYPNSEVTGGYRDEYYQD